MKRVDSGITTLLSEIGEGAARSGSYDWSSGDALTAGGLMAVVGGIADKTGLFNTGAAVGLLGGTARTRYQFDVQQTAYSNAGDAMACVQTQVRLLNDLMRGMVIVRGTGTERQNAAKAPTLAIDAVNKARQRLIRDLRNIKSDSPSRQELESLAKKFSDAEKAPALSRTGSGKGILKELAGTNISEIRKLEWIPSGSGDDLPDWFVDQAISTANDFPGELERCVIK